MTTDLMQKFPTIEILKDEALNKYTHTKIGGPADWLAFPTTVAETKLLVDYAREVQLPLTVLGNSSNLIIKDGGIRGLVLMMTKLLGIERQGDEIAAMAGELTIATSEFAYQEGLTGLEWAAGIPGSIGGAIFMNAGAYGGETKDVMSKVDVLTRAGEFKTYTLDEAQLAYRDSIMQHNHDVVLRAYFALQPGDKVAIRAVMDDFNFRRASKQPLELPSAGSTFKRPVGYFAGKLIMEADLQGFRVGGAEVSTKHAGFVVNIDNASANDFLAVIRHVQVTVWAKDQVRLETEVRILGDD